VKKPGDRGDIGARGAEEKDGSVTGISVTGRRLEISYKRRQHNLDF
jgi:hypothetical protein